MGAKRALGRWGWRLVRREWREQFLVLALITVSIAAASVLGTMGHHAEQPDSVFTGQATHRLRFSGDDVATDIERILEVFPDAEVTSRIQGVRDGTADSFMIESLPVTSAFGAKPIRLLDGRLPIEATELAISDGLASMAGLTVESTPTINGHEVQIVGLIEDPSSLGRPFALSSDLSAFSNSTDPMDSQAIVLINATQAEIDEVAIARSSNAGAQPVIGVDSYQIIDYRFIENLSLDDGAQRIAGFVVLMLTAIVLLEIALLCSAGFLVLGQRRIRQFGLLGAIGATPSHLRQALRLNGLVLGLVGGLFGVSLGYLISLLARPAFEQLLSQRIQTWSVPWLILLPFVALAGAAGLLAAWWPAKGLAKVPIVSALAARPPVASSTARSGLLGASMFVGGAVGLRFAVQDGAGLWSVLSLIVAVVGLLLITPMLTSVGGRMAHRVPLGPRIALRDLARHPNRTATALASLVVALGIPLGITLTSASADAKLDGPNLPDNWALIMPESMMFGGPIAADQSDFGGASAAIQEILPGATLAGISVPLAPLDIKGAPVGGRSGSLEFASQVSSCVKTGDGLSCRSHPVWVASPDLLSALGLDPALAQREAELLGESTEPISFMDVNWEPDGRLADTIKPTRVQPVPYGMIPDYFVPEATLAAQGLEAREAGWLVVNSTPLTPEENEALLAAFGGDGLSGFGGSQTGTNPLIVQTQRSNEDDADIRRNVVIVGAIFSLTIVAAMVSLLQVDSVNDDRTMAAIGAPAGIRRQIVASTAGFLAFGGALLALPGGYLALLAITSDRLAGYPFVFPVAEIGVLLVGVPLVATLVAAMLVRSEPKKMSRATLS